MQYRFHEQNKGPPHDVIFAEGGFDPVGLFIAGHQMEELHEQLPECLVIDIVCRSLFFLPKGRQQHVLIVGHLLQPPQDLLGRVLVGDFEQADRDHQESVVVGFGHAVQDRLHRNGAHVVRDPRALQEYAGRRAARVVRQTLERQFHQADLLLQDALAVPVRVHYFQN